jgi:hypothetical protein
MVQTILVLCAGNLIAQPPLRFTYQDTCFHEFDLFHANFLFPKKKILPANLTRRKITPGAVDTAPNGTE